MSGKFGSADLVADVLQLLHTTPVGKTTTVSVRFANRNIVPSNVSVAIGSNASLELKDYITYNLQILPNGLHEDSGIVMSPGEKLWVKSSTDNVSVRAFGFED